MHMHWIRSKKEKLDLKSYNWRMCTQTENNAKKRRPVIFTIASSINLAVTAKSMFLKPYVVAISLLHIQHM